MIEIQSYKDCNSVCHLKAKLIHNRAEFLTTKK
jgi:hypothetical protein